MRRLIEATKVAEGRLTPIDVDGKELLATRYGDRYFVWENRCPHLGWSLKRGTVSGTTVRCPWHGSTFDLVTGRNEDWTNSLAGVPMPRWTHRLLALGRGPAPLGTIQVEVLDGWILTSEF